MNYFLKKHFRLLTVLLTVCLMMTILSGCSRAKSEDETDPSDDLPSGLVEVKPTETEPEPTETTEPVNENMAIVKGVPGEDQLGVRSSPSSGSKVLGFLDAGTEVEIIKTQTYMGIEWALIREGWIVLDHVEMKNGSNAGTDEDTPEVTEPAVTEPETTNTNTNTTKITGKITANGLYIRKEASKDADVVGSYTNGTTVTILETKNGWGRTDKGWISMTYVSTTGNTTTTNTNTTTTTTTDGNTYFVTANELNIRDEASTNGNKVGTYVAGDKIVVKETSNGWGKTDKGWVSMNYCYKNGDTGTNTAKGIVTGEGLNIRSGPGTGYDSVGNYTSGSRVSILEQINGWGCTDKGWISMKYVYVDGTEGPEAGTGTVTGDNVNIRSGPGTGYASVGSLSEGDEVEILAQFLIGDSYWGCTSKGWICMDYVGVG